jgi:prepilin-type N-terminal cleavage/methylation domain-containing protein
MKSKFIENHLRRQAAILASMRNAEGGFTLTELLVVVIISSIIVSALLGLVVQLTGTEQRESVRTETQREMQMALNYIASDLRQAVYIYEGEAHPQNAASDPSYIAYLPADLQNQANYRLWENRSY